MVYSSVLRCLVVCFAFGALVSATKLQESKLLQQTPRHRLEKLKNELVEATKKSIESNAKDDAERQIKSLLGNVKVTNRTASKTEVKVTNRTASKTEVKVTNRTASKTALEDLAALQELFKETDRTASKEPVKVTNRTASKETVKVTNRTASKEPVKDTNRSDLKARDDGDEDDEDEDEDEDEDNDDDDEDEDEEDDDDDDDDDEDEDKDEDDDGDDDDNNEVDKKNIHGTKSDFDVDAFDAIYYTAAVLVDEIKTECGIDIAAIYDTYSPATLKDANDAQANLFAATQKLSATLSAAPDFTDVLDSFLNSNEYSDAKVSEKINKTMENIDKTLESVHEQLFCAEAKIIAIRLKMSLYGGVGFANENLCNKVSIEFGRYGNDAAKLLKATSDDKDALKRFAGYLVEDIKCYKKELEAFQKVVPVTPFTAESPLQTAAFTNDFFIDYGVVLFYHRIVISIEASIIGLCASGDDDDDSDNDDNDVNKDADDEKSITNQLHSLLTKLKEVSAKKKAAQEALSDRAESSMPVKRENALMKSSHYRNRINN